MALTSMKEAGRVTRPAQGTPRSSVTSTSGFSPGALSTIRGSFLLAPLRQHPRFEALLRRARLQ